MKVAITSNTLNYGGAERQRVALANELVNRGYRVVFIILQSSGPLQLLLEPEVEVVLADGSIPWKKRLRDSRVLITGTTNTETFFGLIAATLSRRCMWVVAAHNPITVGETTYPLFARSFMKMSDVQVCLSTRQRDALIMKDGFSPTKTKVIPNGIDVERFLTVPAPGAQMRSRPIRLGFIGRLVEQKGLDILHDALLQLPMDRWTLDVYGEGPLSRMGEDERYSAIAQNINWHGSSVSSAALENIDVLVVPSRNEAFPLVVLEAMVAGRPVIATDVGSLPEIATASVVLVDPCDSKSLSRAIERLFDRSRLKQLSDKAQKGRGSAASLYSSRQMADRYAALFPRPVACVSTTGHQDGIRLIQIGPNRDVPGGIAQVIGDYERVAKADGLRPEYLPTSWTGGHVSDGRATARVFVRLVRLSIAGERVVVHAHLSQGGSFLREGGCIAIASLLGQRTVASLHGSRFGDFAARNRGLVKAVLHRADAILTLTPEASAIVGGIGLSSRSHRISNWIDGGFGDPAPSSHSMLVVFAGEVGYRKGVDTLIEAWRDVISQLPEARLELIGPIADTAVIASANEFANDQVSVLGALPHARVLEEIRKADLVVLPSRGEAMPKVLIEAFALGRPVVATRVGAVSEMVEPEYGRLVEPGDSVTLAKMIVEVLSDNDFKDSATAKAHARYELSYTARTAAPRLLHLYEDMSQRPRRFGRRR